MTDWKANHDNQVRIKRNLQELHAAALHERDSYRAALEEILSPPDASKGEYYGCLDLHEARAIAADALQQNEGGPDGHDTT